MDLQTLFVMSSAISNTDVAVNVVFLRIREDFTLHGDLLKAGPEILGEKDVCPLLPMRAL